MLIAKAVGYSVGARALVQAANVEVASGEVVALMGPNGAGKSTLMKLLAGDLRPQSGEIQLNGRSYADWRPEARARLRAVLPQHLDLAFPFSAFEVAMLGRIPHYVGAPSRHDREVVQETLEVVDAAAFAEQPYMRLSGGERARVQLARVFAQVWDPHPAGPRMLLLDEPTAPLDIAHQLELMRHLRALVSRDIGVLMIVHDLNLAAGHADRILMLRQGQLRYGGAPLDVIKPDVLREVFDVEARVILPNEASHSGPTRRPQIVFESCARHAA